MTVADGLLTAGFARIMRGSVGLPGGMAGGVPTAGSMWSGIGGMIASGVRGGGAGEVVVWRRFWVSVVVLLAMVVMFGFAGEQDRRDDGVDLTADVNRGEVVAWLLR